MSDSDRTVLLAPSSILAVADATSLDDPGKVTLGRHLWDRSVCKRSYGPVEDRQASHTSFPAPCKARPGRFSLESLPIAFTQMSLIEEY